MTSAHEGLPPTAPRGEIRLLLGGDVMTGRGIDQAMRDPVPPVLHEPVVRDAREYLRLAQDANGPIDLPVPDDYPWGDALQAMDRLRPHLRIVNLETAITRRGVPSPGKAIHYRMSPTHAGLLGAARIDACALANNHLLDWGEQGLADTLQALDAHGVAHAGAGIDGPSAEAPAVLPLPDGRRLLLFSWAAPDCGLPPGWGAGARRPGVAQLCDLDEAGAQQVRAAVQAARRLGDRDRVLVSLHWGANWVLQVPERHRRFARRLIELEAADVVHGHSSHHPLPFEVVRGRLVLYGCGDLINDYEGIGPRDPLRSDLGCMMVATLCAGTGRLRGLDIVPMQLRRLRLNCPDPEARRWLSGSLVPACRALGTMLEPGTREPWRLSWVPQT